MVYSYNVLYLAIKKERNGDTHNTDESKILILWFSVQFSCSVMSDSLWPHELQHARPPCPSPTPGVYPNPCPLSRRCHPTIPSSVAPFSCPQSFPASGSFPMSQLIASGGQSIGVSASTSVLPMNTQDWSPLGWTGWISLQSKGLQESSPTPQFKSINSLALGFLYSPTLTPIQEKVMHPTPVLLPGKSHGWRSLVGCSLWGREESDTAERLHFHFLLSRIGEGNGNPLQCSCLENPRDGGAWWAAVYGVAQSRTRLKRLSSSSSIYIMGSSSQEFYFSPECFIGICGSFIVHQNHFYGAIFALF